MLDQLKAAVNLAQAIKADADRILAEARPKPKRTRPYRTYTFTDGIFGLHMTVISSTGRSRVTGLSRSEYDRFVAVANTGAYVITIENSDFGVAWTLSRKNA